jgi:4-hydroxy-3-methylbut-2-enyl diphosphate reductase
MDVLLANPRGFCAGVERAIEIVERAIEQIGAPIYVRHEIVHNKYVVDDLRKKGAVFVECPRKFAATPRRAASRCSTPPARW